MLLTPNLLTEKTENTVSLTLTENEETLGIYPFRFVFTVTYKVSEGKLDISYGVKNPAGIKDFPAGFSFIQGLWEPFGTPNTSS